MKRLSEARNECQPHYGETRFRDEGKRADSNCTQVDAACSAIKGSAIKDSETANGI